MQKIIIHTINGLFSSVVVPNDVEVEVRNFDNDTLETPVIEQERQGEIGEMIYPQNPNNDDTFLKLHLNRYQSGEGSTKYYFDVYLYR